MAHIIPKYHSVIEFYISRFLRIYVPYYFILNLVIIISLFSGYFNNYWGEIEPFISQMNSNGYEGVALSAISNITLYFQDWIMFIKHDVGEGLTFTANFHDSKAPLYHYLMIPQAWTIGVELSFYLLVPLLNGQTNKTLLLVFLLSLLLRVFSYECLGLKNDPWNYRFFPFEVAIFILGMLSNRFYRFIKNAKYSSHLPVIEKNISYLIGVLLMSVFFYTSKKGTAYIAARYMGSSYAELLSYIAWALLIPVLFLLFEKVHYDRYIGELSYPVYLSHLFVIIYTKKIMIEIGVNVKYLGFISALTTIAISIIIYRHMMCPVDKKRYELAAKIADKVSRRLKTLNRDVVF